MIQVQITYFKPLLPKSQRTNFQWRFEKVSCEEEFTTAGGAGRAFLKFAEKIGAPTHERYVLLDENGMPKESKSRFLFIRPDGSRFTITEAGQVKEVAK
jgi:hypothetical protein